jgi:hypothetical protein
MKRLALPIALALISGCTGSKDIVLSDEQDLARLNDAASGRVATVQLHKTEERTRAEYLRIDVDSTFFAPILRSTGDRSYPNGVRISSESIDNITVATPKTRKSFTIGFVTGSLLGAGFYIGAIEESCAGKGLTPCLTKEEANLGGVIATALVPGLAFGLIGALIGSGGRTRFQIRTAEDPKPVFCTKQPC